MAVRSSRGLTRQESRAVDRLRRGSAIVSFGVAMPMAAFGVLTGLRWLAIVVCAILLAIGEVFVWRDYQRHRP